MYARSAQRRSGLLLMLAAVTLFTIMAAMVKLLRGGGMSTPEVMAWRMGPGIPLVVFELRRLGGRLRPRRPRVVAARSVFGGLAMGTYFWAVQMLTLLQYTVLHLAQPVFVAVLAPLVLRERLRGAALIAVVLALAGAALVIVPDELVTIGLAVTTTALAMPLVPGLAGLMSAMFSALAHMSVRMATVRNDPERNNGEPDAPETVVLYFMSSVTIVCVVVGLASGGFRTLPTGMSLAETAGLIASMAAAGVGGQLCMSRAYARTQAPAVAIVGYAGIPLSMVLDVLLWNAPAQTSALLGAGLMFVAGVLLARAQREPRPASLPVG